LAHLHVACEFAIKREWEPEFTGVRFSPGRGEWPLAGFRAKAENVCQVELRLLLISTFPKRAENLLRNAMPPSSRRDIRGT